MARQQPQGRPRNEIGFREIELLKEQNLGVGSYGSVCKARCDHILCAAKIIHPTLVPPNALQQISPQREHRLPIRRFEMECDFLREIKHPNIIQYLGMYRDPETGLPVLLMELMDESLTHFLESSTEPIPYHIQLTISLDIICALSFLHLNGIIHRDLSSNNILLIGKGRAKLTDFGMAKLVNISGVSNTMCPGTNVYMPPEAIDNQAVYTEKGDVFSFGVNVIQILIRKFPDPANQFKTVSSRDPQFSSGRVEVRVAEIERRNNHISKINPTHPLLPIALDCLKDQESERPSAGELCQRLAALKDTPEYTESGIRHQHQITEVSSKEHDEQIQQVITARQQDIQVLREELNTAQATIREKEQIIATRDQYQRDHEEMIAQFQRRIEELELNSRPQPHTRFRASSDIARATPPTQPSRGQKSANLRLPLADIARATPPVRQPRGHQPAQRPPSASSGEGVTRLNWTQGRKAPCKMQRLANAVVDGSWAYFNPAWTRKLYAYDSTTSTWSRLPNCRTEHPTLVVVNGLLTTVGGENSNKLFSLRGRKWTEVFPPMATKRHWLTALCIGRALIVASGMREYATVVTAVEIMNTITRQWCTAAGIPIPMLSASATVCGDRMYMGKGKTVITCSLSALLQSCRPKIFEAQASTPSPQGPVWSTVTDLPVEQSTLVSINNRLLAIGGRNSDIKPTTEVYLYDPVNNSWPTTSHLLVARRLCFAVVFPYHRIMVVGGATTESYSSQTDTVLCATLVRV